MDSYEGPQKAKLLLIYFSFGNMQIHNQITQSYVSRLPLRFAE